MIIEIFSQIFKAETYLPIEQIVLTKISHGIINLAAASWHHFLRTKLWKVGE